MTRRRTLAFAAGLLLTACTSGPSEEAAPSATPASTTAASAPTPRTASIPPRPAEGRCYALSFDQATAATTDAAPVSCTKPHTTVTFFSGALTTAVRGHLLAVDSERAQRQPANECPRRLRGFVGATPADLRISMLRATWFSPSLTAAADGEAWFRCDVIALAKDGALAPLRRGLKGALSNDAAASRYGVCGSARPGTKDFQRVICANPHAWRAIGSYDVSGESRYPGPAALRAAGTGRCRAAAKARADDALNFGWALDWPTQELWESGQRWGLCWAPD